MTQVTDGTTLREDFLDVGSPNAVAMRDMLGEVECERGLEPGTLVDHLWANLPAGWTAEDVLGEYVPLAVYSTVEWNFFRQLGDPQRARAMAKQAMRFQFGGILLNDFFRFWARLLLPPEHVYGTVVPDPKTMRTYNLNKRLEVSDRSETSVTYRVLYQDNAGNRYPRTPEEDIGSLVFWAPGFTAATAALWVEPAEITYHHLELDLIECLHHFREFMQELTVEVQNDKLMVNGQIVAQRITCYLDARGHFTSLVSPDRDAAHGEVELVESKSGWQITRDITVVAPDGTPWIAAYTGTVFVKQSGCSLIQYSWAPHSSLGRIALGLFTRFTRLNWVRRLMDRPLSDRLQLMEAAETIRCQKAHLRQLAIQNRAKQVDTYPTPAMADLVVSNRYRQRTVPGVAMFLDIAGSTELTERIGSEASAERMDQFWAEVAQLLWRYSAWNPERGMGDPIVWVADEPGDGAMLVISYQFDPSPDDSLHVLKPGLVVTGLDLARAFHDAIAKVSDANGRPLRLRCGLAYGEDITLRVRGLHGGRMAASGKSLNAAARYEAAGKLPGVAAPDGRTTVLPLALARLVADEFEFTAAGTHHLKGLEAPTELMRLVEDPVIEAQAYTPLFPPGTETQGVQHPTEPVHILRFPADGGRGRKNE